MLSRYPCLSASLCLMVILGGNIPLAIPPAIAEVIRPELRTGSTGIIVKELQSALKLLGYYEGEVTGDYDEATVIAVYRFQKAAELPETGIVDQKTWSALFPNSAQEADAATEDTETVASDSTPQETDTSAEQPEQAKTETPAETTESSSAPSTASNTPKPENLPLLKEGMEGDAVILLQQRLKALGFFPDAIDGIFGRQTLAAVIEAQTKFELQGDGIVGYHTWRKLLE